MAEDDRIKMQELARSDKGRYTDRLFQGVNIEMVNPEELTFDNFREMIQDSVIRSSLQIIINGVPTRGWELNGGRDDIREFSAIWCNRDSRPGARLRPKISSMGQIRGR